MWSWWVLIDASKGSGFFSTLLQFTSLPSDVLFVCFELTLICVVFFPFSLLVFLPIFLLLLLLLSPPSHSLPLLLSLHSSPNFTSWLCSRAPSPLHTATRDSPVCAVKWVPWIPMCCDFSSF